MIFLKSVDNDLWDFVMNDATKRNDFKLASINEKAITISFSGLIDEELNRISFCKTAKDIWHNLKITYGRTSYVNKSNHVDYVYANEDAVTEPHTVDKF